MLSSQWRLSSPAFDKVPSTLAALEEAALALLERIAPRLSDNSDFSGLWHLSDK